MFDETFFTFETVLEFLAAALKEKLTKWKPDITYLTNLFDKFNEVNLQLRADSLNMGKQNPSLLLCLGRLKQMKQNVGFCEFHLPA